jgi:hypothetical protein
MKRSCTFLLFALFALSAVAMEEEEPFWTKTTNFFQNTFGASNTSFSWQEFSFSGSNHQTAAITTQEHSLLQPVYLESTETKRLLNTLKPDPEAIKQLYTFAYEIVQIYTPAKEAKKNAIIHDPLIPELIAKMNRAKEKYIGYETMASYGHQNKKIFPRIGTALIFFCLRAYHLTILETKEAIPFTRGEKITYLKLSKYPAYLHLVDSISNIIQLEETNREYLEYMLSWIYNNNGDFDDYYTENYTNFKNEFYNLANSLLGGKNSPKEEIIILSKILQLVERAIKTKSENISKDFGNELLYFVPTKGSAGTWETMMGELATLTKDEDEPINAQRRIAVLWNLILRYNNDRLNKATPTAKQYLIYDVQRQVNAALPNDNFRNKLDPKNYAFIEFENLQQDIAVLKLIDDHEADIGCQSIYGAS